MVIIFKGCRTAPVPASGKKAAPPGPGKKAVQAPRRLSGRIQSALPTP